MLMPVVGKVSWRTQTESCARQLPNRHSGDVSAAWLCQRSPAVESEHGLLYIARKTFLALKALAGNRPIIGMTGDDGSVPGGGRHCRKLRF